MMMTMTGRVLLVCALCVLWCGAGGGGCSETPSVISGNASDENTQKEKEMTVVGGEEGEQESKQAAPQATSSPTGSGLRGVPVNPPQTTQPGGEASDPANTTKDNKDQNKKDKKEEKEEKKENQDEEEDDKNEEEGKDEDKDDVKEEDGEEEKRKKMRKKIISAPQWGCQQAIKSSQFYLLVWKKHRTKQNPKALKQLATKTQLLMVQGHKKKNKMKIKKPIRRKKQSKPQP
ncbi:mucin-associated surface protein (MASP) [Trypanosoma cruzi]|nr:mucin-associated surface protein (MASP) [Trypanosoma cruzi]